jgi:AFG3 family protein
MVLGNVDHFLENLERVQIERGRALDQFIPVEFKHGVDTNKVELIVEYL